MGLCPLRKSYFLSILIIPIIMIILSPSVSFADADRIFKENNKAVVVIMVYDQDGKPISQGSGFIVRADGVIVTNYHVISNAEDIKIKVGDKILEVEGLLHIDKENDLVILKAKGENFQTVKIGDIEKLSVGEKIYVISSPQGLENTISDGILSGIREIDTKRKILQITAPISKGSSGGAVFNKNGEVIGVTTFILEEAQNLNFAMPVSLIKDKISIKKIITFKDAGIEDYKKTAGYWFYSGYYWLELGYSLQNPDLYIKAINAFKQSLKIKQPDEAKSYVYAALCLAYSNSDMLEEAIEACRNAIKIEPANKLAYYSLGHTYIKLKNYEKAGEFFTQTIKLDPIFSEAYEGLGRTYNFLGVYSKALEACKQAIKLRPDFTEAFITTGFAYWGLGMFKDAIEAFKEAIMTDPSNSKPSLMALARSCLGDLYVFTGNRELALEQYKILKSLDPKRAEDLFNNIYK